MVALEIGKDKNESGYFMKPWTTRCVLHASEESIVTSKALGRRPTVYTKDYYIDGRNTRFANDYCTGGEF